MKKSILVIAVHPDDETLGAGGSLLKWKNDGHDIHWLIMTKIDERLGYSKEKIDSRQTEISKVSKLYGFKSVTQLNFLTTKLDQYLMRELVGELSKAVSSLKPDTLIVPFRYDAHSDHRVTYEALMPFMKSFRYPFITRVLAMETLSETGYSTADARESFVPNYFVDVTSTMSSKISAMKEYVGELGQHPFPRSELAIVAQAHLRGSMMNVESAEAFQILKLIEMN